MPAVAPMSPASEQRLLDALEKVADLTNDGSDPSEAIAKCAAEAQIPAGHIHLMVHAYNTGRTTAQRRAADDPWEKAATFPIADTSKILALMYPDQPQTAAEQQKAAALSSDYELPPDYLVRRFQDSARRSQVEPYIREKSASAPVQDQSVQIRQRQGAVERLQKSAAEARRRVTLAHTEASITLDRLFEALQERNAPSLAQVKDACLRLHGEEVRSFFSYLEQRRPALLKRAAVFGPARGPVYDLVNQCLELRSMVAALEVDYQQKKALAQHTRQEYLTFLGQAGPEPHPLLPGVFLEEKQGASEYKFPLTKFVGGASQALLGPMAKSKSEASLKAFGQAHEIKKPDADPAMANEERMLKHKMIAQELLSNDEVLAGHDPHEVLNAYKEISDIAPQAAQRSAIARDFVRRRMAGGQLSYFDLEALTRLNNNLAGIKRDKD